MLIFNIKVFSFYKLGHKLHIAPWGLIYVQLCLPVFIVACICISMYIAFVFPFLLYLCFHFYCICVSIYIVFVFPFILYLCFHLYCTNVFVAASISTACVCYLLTNAPLCNILLSILPLHTLTYLFLVLPSKYAAPRSRHIARKYFYGHTASRFHIFARRRNWANVAEN